jgi:tRNA-modifying protein YgfZ
MIGRDLNMTAEQFQEIEQHGGCVNLSDRARFRLAGADCVRYLNGQVTHDVRMANDRETIYACVTDLKGRIVGDVFIHAAAPGTALLLDAEPPLREVLGPRLEKYIISDDAELTDVTDEWQQWHVFGPAAAGVQQVAGIVLKSDRLGMEGVDIWLPAEETPPVQSCPLVSAENFEILRILRGIPRYPNELNGDTFPPEAGLDERAMSYTKGCYIGQEVLSRIRTTGRMPRELVRWEAADAKGKIVAGDALLVPQDGGEPRPIGKVTSVAWHPVLERLVGLAYLKQGCRGADSELLVSSDTPNIAIKVKISPDVKQ